MLNCTDCEVCAKPMKDAREAVGPKSSQDELENSVIKYLEAREKELKARLDAIDCEVNQQAIDESALFGNDFIFELAQAKRKLTQEGEE